MVKCMNIFGRKEQRINHMLLSAVACSPKYKYDSRGRIKVGTKLRYHELFSQSRLAFMRYIEVKRSTITREEG